MPSESHYGTTHILIYIYYANAHNYGNNQPMKIVGDEEIDFYG